MAFLIEQIREQKYLEMEVNVDEFIKEKGISESSLVFELRLDKTLFPEKENALEYLKSKCYWDIDLGEEGDNWVAVVGNPKQLDLDTMIELEIRNGVTVKAADLLPVPQFEEIQFNEKGEVSLSTKFGTIDLNTNTPHIIEIAKVAEGEHPAYGHLKITQEHLESMVNNFNSKATGVDLAVNEDHRKNEAFGWFKDIFLSFDKQTLYGQIVWNAKGTQALSEKEYRYFSPEFRFNYVHPHTGEEHGPTLLGGALTNYPFLKMEAITELNHKQQQEGKIVTEKTIDLSVHTEKVVELSSKITDLQVELNTKTTENSVLTQKVAELEKTIELNAKKASHQKLFSEGKINAAQLEALNSGKNALEVLSLNDKINSKAQGSDTNTDDEIALSADEKAVAAKLGLTEEEYQATK